MPDGISPPDSGTHNQPIYKMQVFYGFEQLPSDFADNRQRAVAVGSFDGVHRGHRLLIAQMAELGESVVVTFDPHPRQVLRGENRLLTTLPEKLELLAETPVDYVVVVPFTLEFSRIDSETFTEEYLIKRLGARYVLSGEGHHFGHNRGGTEGMLREHGLSTRYTGRYENISSTDIRSAIERGDMRTAGEMLGGPYLILTSPHDPTKLLPPDDREYEVECDGKRSRMRINREIFGGPFERIRIIG